VEIEHSGAFVHRFYCAAWNASAIAMRMLSVRSSNARFVTKRKKLLRAFSYHKSDMKDN